MFSCIYFCAVYLFFCNEQGLLLINTWVTLWKLLDMMNIATVPKRLLLGHYFTRGVSKASLLWQVSFCFILLLTPTSVRSAVSWGVPGIFRGRVLQAWSGTNESSFVMGHFHRRNEILWISGHLKRSSWDMQRLWAFEGCTRETPVPRPFGGCAGGTEAVVIFVWQDTGVEGSGWRAPELFHRKESWPARLGTQTCLIT